MALTRNLRYYRNIFKQLQTFNVRSSALCQDVAKENSQSPEKKSGGFAQAFEKHTKAVHEETVTKEESFATLFRKSAFIDLGDPEGKTVIGKIFHIVGDDLYIDFGWKFNCVCTRPQKNSSDYVRGAKVRLLIKDLELSTKFLGSDKDLTILESDAVLVGLVSSPYRSSLQSSLPATDIS